MLSKKYICSHSFVIIYYFESRGRDTHTNWYRIGLNFHCSVEQCDVKNSLQFNDFKIKVYKRKVYTKICKSAFTKTKSMQNVLYI